MSLVSKSFSDIVTFSRSSNATRIGPTGRVEYAPHNLILQSQTFDNAYWTKYQSTVTSNAVAAPNGTVTADTLIEDTVNDAHAVFTIISLDVGTYTLSVYIKALSGNRNVGIIPANNGVMGSNGVVVFSGTGVFVSTSGTGIQSYSSDSVGNGWYRLAVVFTITTSGTAVPVIRLQDGSNSSYTGDGTSGIYLWGAQLSVGPYPLDYTPTTSAAVYGPRFDYDPVTLAARGLLIEEQRTNLVIYSEDFSNAAWTSSGVTITANSATAPDGTFTADTYNQGTATTYHECYQTVASAAGAGTYTYSVFAKAVSNTYLNLSVYTAALQYAGAVFNLSTGVVTSSAASTYTGLSTAITSFGNGWYKCSITFTKGSTTSPVIDVVAPLTTTIGDYGLTGTFTGTSKEIYIWGAQLEAGSFATSYIPTLASSVTRSADVASVNTLSPWFNSVESTLYAEGSYIGLTSGVTQTLAGLTAPVTSDYLLICKSSGTGQNFAEVLTSASPVASFNLGSPSVSTIYKIALAAKANDFAAVQNGGSVSTDTSGAMPSGIASLGIGYLVAGAPLQLNGHIRRIAYYPRRLTNAELQSITS